MSRIEVKIEQYSKGVKEQQITLLKSKFKKEVVIYKRLIKKVNTDET